MDPNKYNLYKSGIAKHVSDIESNIGHKMKLLKPLAQTQLNTK